METSTDGIRIVRDFADDEETPPHDLGSIAKNSVSSRSLAEMISLATFLEFKSLFRISDFLNPRHRIDSSSPGSFLYF